MKAKPLLSEFVKDNFHNKLSLAKQLEKTACRYATPSGCCGRVIYMMNRIKNIVLSLIGCSDWQRTQRAIREELNTNNTFLKNSIKAKKFVRTMPELPSKHKQVAEKIINRSINRINNNNNSYAQLFLDLALKIQSGKIEDRIALANDKTIDAILEKEKIIMADTKKQFADEGLSSLCQEIGNHLIKNED